ncbi:hypothetical protein [Enterococcus larvae]|uniref:hypothetical protein n=1 Tax=Enterococcus larvae TaxID=2794352 RepID=UPI003F2C2596
MTILAWIIMGATAGAILCVLFAIYFFVKIILQSRKLKKITKRPPKNKKKRRRWENTRSKLQKKRKKSIFFSLFLLFLAVGLGGASVYTNYYQSINLSSDDSTLIVRSYYLLRDFQEELQKAADETEDKAASQQNIRYLATTMAAYSTKQASTLNTKEGQSALNRYYAALSELGVNATRESNNFYGNSSLVEAFQMDIEKTIARETSAFDYFKVNQSGLEEEGASDDE